MSQSSKSLFQKLFIFLIVNSSIAINSGYAKDLHLHFPGNFGLPGIIDLPTARRFPDGELNITQQLHESLARTGISFQALPRVGLAFRYSGHGVGGNEANGRFNHDRSFDVQISVSDETKYIPAISLGLRDFIGTGFYSSEYIVGSKTLGNLELTGGLGFGRLSGRNSFSNPLRYLSSNFKERSKNEIGRGGTLGTINWFQGKASPFFGVNYQIGKQTVLSSEYTPDLMSYESNYLNLKSPWNFGISYKLNNYVSIAANYLHGSQISFTTNVSINPNKPPLAGGKELAPVPMRLRGESSSHNNKTEETVIRRVLNADRFEIHSLSISGDRISISVTNTKFRSTTQAVGRVASTLQRFTSDNIKFAVISFYQNNLYVAHYKIDLTKITNEQFNPSTTEKNDSSIIAIDVPTSPRNENKRHFSWGIGPYVTHRLFNPDLPLSMEAGVEFAGGYKLAPGLSLSGSLRKSVITNLTDNQRRSNSVLPRVHSDWPLYDFGGQGGHINSLTLSYSKNLSPGFYGMAHAGLLEPFFAGFGGEILYKPAQSAFAIGIDIHKVKQRDFDMLFKLRNYEKTIGHVTAYYDAGKMFSVEVNVGRYLAGDWGSTVTVSRKFGSGWEVGGYATLTDIPFETFGEGSFDKAIYVTVPLDWIVSSPNRTKRRLTIRPITRDGGANLSSARKLYKEIESSQNAAFKREIGRLWK